MNNANCYALDAKAKFIYDSDQEEEYQFDGPHIVRTQKSMSMMSSKQPKLPKDKQMKKSNSFLLTYKAQPPVQVRKPNLQSKDKSKTSKTGKKLLNVTEGSKKVAVNSKNSMMKTSESIGSASCKSIKTNKNRSMSRDYLILDSHIYACQNIEQVNQRLICKNEQLYSHARFVKSTLKNQAKIETYLLAFADYFSYQRKIKVQLSDMTVGQKKKLYLFLKSTVEPVSQPKYNISDLINEACAKIERKTAETIIENAQHAQQVRLWKNVQLHQLMEIQGCLQETEISKETLPSSTQDISCQRIKHASIDATQTNDRFQHQSLSKQEGISAHRGRADQKFPRAFETMAKNQHRVRGSLADTHMFSKEGIEKFLQNLWDFLVDSELTSGLIGKLKESYGLSRTDKVKVIRQSANLTHFGHFEQEDNPILPNQLFVSYCKQKHAHGLEYQQTRGGLPQAHQKSAIIFQKAVFDSLNLELLKFQTDFPLGFFHPLENNPSNSAYLIDEENAMLVWDECIAQIKKSNDLHLGLSPQESGEETIAQIKRHNEQCFKKYLSEQYSGWEWEKLVPLWHRISYESLLKKVEEDLWAEAADQIGLI